MTQAKPEPAALAAIRLWTPAGFRDDDWVHTGEAGDLSGNSRSILPLDVFLALDHELRRSMKGRLGVLLLPGDALDRVVSVLDELSLVALAFPSFSDGRSFSKAELLRSRHRYEGPLRATGQVLIDQLPHMLRVGFDEFEVSHPLSIERLEAGDLGGISLHYQPAARSAPQPAGYAWRRTRAE